MFKNLTDFSYTRNDKEAAGFYFMHLLINFILGAIVGGLVSIDSATYDESFESGLRVGAYVAALYCLVISFLILVRKRLYKNPLYIILALLSPLAAVFLGSLLGLIIPAFMTTRENISEETPTA